MYPHYIRLSVAWRQDSRRIDLPTSGRGPARLVRSFGLPRQIDDYERVWLICDAAGSVRWSFNGDQLAVGPVELDVTGRMRSRNEWVAECDGDWSLGEASLAIRCRAYLRDVRLDGGHLVGKVAGTADGPLELYLLVGDTHAGYRTIAAGESFALPVAGLGPVRVELVNVSTVWDCYEVQIP